MRLKLLQMYRSAVIDGWPASFTCGSGCNSSGSGSVNDLARAGSSSSSSSSSSSATPGGSSSSSVKLRGLAGRAIDGWADCLDARNARRASPFHSAVHFCMPEAVRFFLQDGCFSLGMLTEPTLTGREWLGCGVACTK
jgi:hypothetical protein